MPRKFISIEIMEHPSSKERFVTLVHRRGENVEKVEVLGVHHKTKVFDPSRSRPPRLPKGLERISRSEIEERNKVPPSEFDEVHHYEPLPPNKAEALGLIFKYAIMGKKVKLRR